MADNIFKNLTDEIKTKTEQWTKEAEEAGMTLTEYLESISSLCQPKVENQSIKTVTNENEAENYPISEDISVKNYTYISDDLEE